MAHLEQFRTNVVRDGRSYSDKTFEKAAKILNSAKKGVQASADDVEKFEALVTQLKELKAQVHEEEVSILFDNFLTFIFYLLAPIRRRSRWASRPTNGHLDGWPSRTPKFSHNYRPSDYQ